MTFTLNSLGHPAAAEITGLDCVQPFSEEILRSVKQAYLTYPVLVFRDQKLSAPQLAAFGRYFGKLENYGTPAKAGAAAVKPPVAALHESGGRETPDQMLYLSPDDSDVLIMTNEIHEDLHPIGIVDNAETWHSDGSHKPEPYQAVIVHVLQNPASGGGETEFCDMRMVFAAMPPELQSRLAQQTTVHHWSKSLNPRFAGALDEAARKEGERIASTVPEMRQPMVRTHPETRRPSLYVSPRFTIRIDGIAPQASEAFLEKLFTFADDPTFRYSHTWREGDLMIWDNRCLNHRVCSYAASEIRRRHRVTVAGDGPFYDPARSIKNG